MFDETEILSADKNYYGTYGTSGRFFNGKTVQCDLNSIVVLILDYNITIGAGSRPQGYWQIGFDFDKGPSFISSSANTEGYNLKGRKQLHWLGYAYSEAIFKVNSQEFSSPNDYLYGQCSSSEGVVVFKAGTTISLKAYQLNFS